MAIPTSKLKDVAFSTQFRIEHIALKGHYDWSLGTDPYYNSATFTIPHNLGYIPFFRVFVKFPGSANMYYMATGPATYGLVGAYQIDDIYADATNLYVTLEVSAAGGSVGTIYYRIYAEKQQ